MRLDTIFRNGRFTTLDEARPHARSMGVLAGRVAGFDEELDGVTADLVVDLGGAPSVPGFNDAHHHLSMRGLRMAELDLRASVVSGLDEVYALVAERAKELPAGAWIKGGGYDHDKLGGHPARTALDAVGGDHPVWLQHTSGHAGVAGTAALTRIGWTDLGAVPEVPGGSIGRDADGVPDGLLTERAQQVLLDVMRPVPYEDFVTGIARASEAAVREGLTSFTEPGLGAGLVGNGPADVAAYLSAAERGLLRQRATLMPGSPTLHDTGVFEEDRTWFGLDLGVRTGLGGDRVRIGPVKLFSDGSLLARTAAMCEDFAGDPGNRGFLQEEAEAIRSFILRAHDHGWQIATHAIGDRAIDVVLDAYEEAQGRTPRPDVRHRIEHCAITSDEQVARVARLGVIPVPQGRFVSELGDGMLAAVGPRRARGCYRQRSFLDAGIELPGSSDCPVVDGNPLLGIHDMVNQRTGSGRPFNPGEALTVGQALRAYTVGSAHAVHEEHLKGTLTRGRFADFAVLSDDLMSVAAERIHDITVTATVIGGEIVHDAVGLT